MYTYLLASAWVSIRYLSHSMPKIASLTASLTLHVLAIPINNDASSQILVQNPPHSSLTSLSLSFIPYIHEHILSCLYSRYIQNLALLSATTATALVYAPILAPLNYFLSLLTELPASKFSPAEFIFQVAARAVLLKRTKTMPLLCIKHVKSSLFPQNKSQSTYRDTYSPKLFGL